MKADKKSHRNRAVFLIKLAGSSLIFGAGIAILFKFLLEITLQASLYVLPPGALLFGFWVAPQLGSISLRRALYIATEAAICSGPCVAMVLISAPWVLLGFIVSIQTREFVFSAVILGCLFALFEFWRLSLSTAERKAYEFGIRFCVAAVAFLIAPAYFYRMYPIKMLALLFTPPMLATLHFYYEQRRMQNHPIRTK